jgi:hypothetical protein
MCVGDDLEPPFLSLSEGDLPETADILVMPEIESEKVKGRRNLQPRFQQFSSG